VERDFHKEDDTEKLIKGHFPDAAFLAADHLTEGKACTCLFIAGCETGWRWTPPI